MYYTIYKTTNNINGKYYIGKHKTKNLDDNYLGSGKILKNAIKKYGIDNFTKEYLFIFDNEDEMNNKEAELVSKEYVKEDTNYNLKLGGEGGWDYNNYINPHPCKKCGKATQDKYRNNKDLDNIRRENLRMKMLNKPYLDIHMNKLITSLMKKYPNGVFYNKTHTEETKKKLRKSKNAGKNNSQYGTMWIYSLEEKISKRIGKNEIIPEGWYKGRKMKFN